jgi:hypothetical protein
MNGGEERVPRSTGAQREPTAGPSDGMGAWAGNPVPVLALSGQAGGAPLAGAPLGAGRKRAMDQILAWLDRHSVNAMAVLGTIAVVVAASLVILLVNRLLRHALRRAESRFSLAHETALMVTRIANVGLWFIAALLVLSLWGVSVGGLWTLLISAAAVIGVGFLAVWTMISNVTASVFITVWRPFQLGQTVELLPESLRGRVIDRNMMFTVLREEGGSVLQVPNNLFFQRVFRVADSEQQYFFELFESRDREAQAASAGAVQEQSRAAHRPDATR